MNEKGYQWDEEIVDLPSLIPKAQEYWNESPVQWDTPFIDLDQAVRLRPGGLLILLCAPPKYGKSTLSLQIALSLAEQDVGTLIWDFENSWVLFRIMSILTGVKYIDLILGIEDIIEGEKVQEAFDLINEKYSKLYICRPTQLTTTIDGYREIDADAINYYLDTFEQKVNTKHHAFFIDSINRLPLLSLDSPTHSITRWIHFIEAVKNERSYLTWVVSQVSRNNYDKKPDLAIAALSSALEFSSEIVIALGPAKGKGKNLVGVYLIVDRDQGGHGFICELDFENSCYTDIIF